MCEKHSTRKYVISIRADFVPYCSAESRTGPGTHVINSSSRPQQVAPLNPPRTPFALACLQVQAHFGLSGAADGAPVHRPVQCCLAKPGHSKTSFTPAVCSPRRSGPVPRLPLALRQAASHHRDASILDSPQRCGDRCTAHNAVTPQLGPRAPGAIKRAVPAQPQTTISATWLRQVDAQPPQQPRLSSQDRNPSSLPRCGV